MPKSQPVTVKAGRKIRLKDFNPGHTGDFKDRVAAEAQLPGMLKKLSELSEKLYADNRYGLLIVLQGMDTAGKDGTVRKVMDGCSPLGTRVVPFKAPTEEELEHDFLWRIHREAPRRGEVVIFNRSHYEDVLVVRVANLAPKKVWKKRYEMINDFESLLTRNRTIVLKFFLHISRDEQKRRLQERLQDPAKNWKFQPGDLKVRTQWDDYQAAYEDALSKCNTEEAPWHRIPANNKWYRNWLIADILIRELKKLDLQFPKSPYDLTKVRVV